MTLARSHSFLMAVGILTVFFTGSIWSLRQSAGDQESGEASVEKPGKAPEAAPPQIPDAPADESKLVLSNFFRSETKEGKKIWEVKAARGRYFPEDNTAKLEDAILWVFRPDKEPMELVAKVAVLYLEGAGLKKADVSDGVTLTQGDEIVIKTEAATFLNAENKVTAQGIVSVRTKRLNITGEGLDADLRAETFTLNENVSTVVTPREKLNG